MKKATTTEKRLSIEEQIKALEQQRKQLVQKERAERNEEIRQRQLLRGGLLEKLLPNLVTLSDEDFESFIKKSLQPEPVLAKSKPSTPTIPQVDDITESEVTNDEE